MREDRQNLGGSIGAPMDTTHGRRIDILGRIAVLEERTKPKQKTIIELIQSYGGVLALLITILYSFPLGLWDRFITTREEERSATLLSLRGSLSELYRLTAEMGKSHGSIQDAAARDMAIRGYLNQILLILSRNGDNYSNNRDELLAEELMSIALAYQLIYDASHSIEFLKYADNRTNTKREIKTEIRRQLAKSLFSPGPSFNKEAARHYYKLIINEFPDDPSHWDINQLASAYYEWAFAETLWGDWKCAVENIEESLKIIRTQPDAQIYHGQLFQQVDQFYRTMKPAPGQREEGCS